MSYHNYHTIEMLLWICDQSALSLGIPPLIKQSSLLSEINPNVINLPTIDTLKEYFTEDAWMSVIQKGMNYNYMYIHTYIVTSLAHDIILFNMRITFHVIVDVLKEDWKCHLCTHITTTENMIQCDFCDKWYHWYVCPIHTCRYNIIGFYKLTGAVLGLRGNQTATGSAAIAS